MNNKVEDIIPREVQSRKEGLTKLDRWGYGFKPSTSKKKRERERNVEWETRNSLPGLQWSKQTASHSQMTMDVRAQIRNILLLVAFFGIYFMICS